MEPVLIECSLCHKRYKLDLGKMQEMGVMNPLCPACKTPLPVTMPPAPVKAEPEALTATGPMSTEVIKQAVSAARPQPPAPVPPPAAPLSPPPSTAASSAPTAPAPITAPQQMIVTTPTPPVAPAPSLAPAPAAAPLPPPDFSSPPDSELEAPDIGESTMSSAAMAAALAERNKLPPGYNFTLSGMDGPAAGMKLTMTQSRCMIGRKRGEFIIKDDSEASSEHATVEIRSLGNYFLTDLGSTNGTYLNEKKISGSAQLNDRDIIRIGASSLLFVVTVIEEEHSAPAPAPAAAPAAPAAPEVLAPPPGAIVTGSLGASGPAPVPAPEEEEMPAGLPGYLPKPTPVPPNYRFYLKFMEGDMTGEVFEMKGGRGYTLGRSRECDVPLGDIKASRQHTKIYILGVDKYFVQDMGSTNGTFLNEQKVLDILPLKNQDQVRVGLTKLKFIVLKLPPGQSGL